ncbi:MAG: PadR family transcriptional regulator [Candidatus Helarchaeota archaeon]
MVFKRKGTDFQLGNLQTQILLMLKYKSAYGYELMDSLRRIRWNVSSGLLYPTLRKLERKGFIESFTSSPLRGQKERKNYKLTLKGADYLQKNFIVTLSDAKYYISSFQELFDTDLINFFEKEILVLNLLNIIGPKTVLNVLFKGKIPKTVEFMEIYDFNEQIKESKEKKWLQILLFMPFSFIIYDFGVSADEKYREMLIDFRKALKDEGRLWIVDIEWTKHAMVDGLTFMMTGEFSKMAYTADEIKNLLLSVNFKNIRLIGSSNGIVIVAADK